MATLDLDSVSKRFGNLTVVHDISIRVASGEFIVIVGPSGCGKSTLLRMVAGLEQINSGTINIDGTCVNDQEPMDRNIAMVFQNYALYPHMSVFANMAYGLKIAATPKDEIHDRVTNAAQMLRLEPYLQRKPRELSGGQRQRVAMGRAIVRKPAIFLFDEPLSNLDAELRARMRLEIKTLQRQLKTTTLYVTHDQVEAMTLADRMIVMNHGYAEQIGAPLAIYTDPETRFAAEFIGAPPMNFVPGTLMSNTAPMVGIRPEHLRIASSSARLKTTVRFCEALGAETLIHSTLADGTKLCLRCPGRDNIPTPGTDLYVDYDDYNLRLFDDSGQRLHA